MDSSFSPYNDTNPSSSSLPSPLTSLSRIWKHHVFPSFYGADVRKTFLSYILESFRRKGIGPFIDGGLETSKSISSELTREIRESKIAVVLFSRNYASSKWCLDELVEIMKCRKELGQTVIPIFYNVDPSDVKKLTGDFGSVFENTCKGKTKGEIKRWRKALEGVATIAGYNSSNWSDEAAMIEEIATNVSNMLNSSTPSRDFDGFVGMRAHMEKMEPLLRLDLDEVKMIGIWGPPGIGKTTIARFLFNQVSDRFQPGPIMVDIKGRYLRPCLDEYSAQLQLQKKMLSQNINHKDIIISHLRGAKEWLKHKKVFLVLDDVDMLTQLDALAKEIGWFGPGSRIIIKTEDPRVLNAHGINHIYKVNFPSSDEAFQIFCMHTFGQKHPYEGFHKLAWEVMALAGNLPLGLKVLGSALRGMSKQEWKRILPNLKTRLDGELESIIKFSYDTLCDEDKYLFLYIACFFNHLITNGLEGVHKVEEILANKFLDVRQGLHVLAERSLISIDEGRIYMHTLLEKFGRETFRKQFVHEVLNDDTIEAEIVQAESKSRRDDNFLGEANSDATCNFENKRVVPVIEEKNLDLSHDFVGHLVKALKKNGVNVDEFPSGDVHFKGIEESRMALVIFSSRYAKSRWCLNELVKIKELMEERKLLVIPIFYKVEPLEVTQLKGDFGVKFWNSWRINRDHHIIEWKEALKSVASMRGINLKEHCSESEFITHTVNKVVYKLPRENPSLFISTGKGKSTDFSKHHPFGMEQRMEQLEKKLEFDCNETLIIGVVGMPGIGKTTLAMRLHEKWNCKFLRCVPLLGIRKKSEEYGLVWLRKTLLEVLLEGKFPAISDKTTHESVKDKLLQKKVFVVLDDVSNKKQLDFLLSDLTWIKKGSKIIITTSDQSLLKGFADDTFVVPLLNDKEAFQLFTYHAFDDQLCSATGNFLSLSRKFVDYARGHPHALISLGIELRGKEEAHWEHRLGIITDRHNTWIQDIWRFSTDQLNEQQKDVFLDIVYFFKSEDEYFVRSLLDSGDPDITDSVSELRDLANKFLITISDGRVEMHNLLYRFSKGLGFPLRHRLWNYEDIINKLRKMELSDAHNVRGIFLDMSKLTKSISLDSSTFMDMRNLRYLKIYDSCCPRQCIADCKLHFPKGLEFPLEEVRYLHWLKFPLKELPKDFRPDNLVDLRLPHSNVERVWEGVKDTPRLKWVDLSHSSNLLDLSALSRAENLQRLNLEGCTILDKLPMEIQYMKSLVFLNLRGCTHLSYLPEMNLVSLKTLILSDCSNLEKFQLISESLEVLHLDGTAIKALPLAIKKLQRLVLLNLKNCEMLECLPKCLGELKALEEIILSGCSRLKNLSDIKENMKHLQSLFIDWIGAKEMPHISCATISEGQASADMVVQPFGPREWPRGVYVVCSLRRLCLSGNDFVSLQTDIGKLYNLNWLDVRQCKLLTSIPMLPPRLQYFDAHGCDSLERVANPLALPVLSEKIHATFNFSNCNKLDQDAKDSILSYTRRKSELVLDALSRHNGGPVLEDFTGSCFPGCEVPAWFSYQASGSLLKQKLPQHWCDNRFTGIALCAVILFPGYYKQRNRLFVKCNCVFNYEDMPYIRFIYTIGSWREPSNTPGKIEPPHVFIGYTNTLDIKKYGKQENEEGCSQTEASFEFQVTDGTDVLEGCKVLKCGFSLVYATDERENIRWDVETVVIPERIENILGKAISYGDPGSRDDIHYESYSGEAKSDANPILLKSLENKKVDLLNEAEDAGREIIDNTSSGNLETLKMHSLVGVELRLKQMEKVLYSTPGKNRIVGVVGMPGSGKTTLAKILFEKRGCKFPSHLFLTMSKECRLEQLGSVLLKELLKHVNQDIETRQHMNL